jgi:UDP-glucuronate decarboxylase
MLELADAIKDLTGSASRIVFEPLPEDDPTQRQPDISLARKELNNWEPKIQLKEGLAKTIKYFEKLLSGSSLK